MLGACSTGTAGSPRPADTQTEGSSAVTSPPPTSIPAEPDLTGDDPCDLADAAQVLELGYTAPGDLGTDQPSQPQCIFDGPGAAFVTVGTSVGPDYPYDYFVGAAPNKTVATVDTGQYASVSVITAQPSTNCLVAVRIRDDQVVLTQSNNGAVPGTTNCQVATALATTAATRVG